MEARRFSARIFEALLQLAAAATLCGAVSLLAQAPTAQAGTSSAATRVPLDRIVAVVNGDLILESDVDTEQRFDAFSPLRAEGDESRRKIINRLIDRDLILQQMKQQPQAPVTDQELDAQLAEVRKTIPACPTYHCDTEAGWKKFAADHGFTVEEVRARWRLRMEVLRFIEQRFRMGIRISQQEIDDYYKSKIVPAYQKQNATPPSEASINDRIQEVLLQQQVTNLLDDWLKALRAQGSVVIMNPQDAPQ